MPMSLWKLLCCLLGGAFGGVAAAREPTLPIGECVVTVPASVHTPGGAALTFKCQLAAFGAYLPHVKTDTEDLRVALAPGDSMLACSPLPNNTENGVDPRFEHAIVVARRGHCSFQKKLTYVAAAGAAALVLVNSEESLIPLSSLEHERSNAFAVSVTKSDGEKLIELVAEQRDTGPLGLPDEIFMRMTASISPVQQAQARMQFLVYINAPVAVYEAYMDAVESLGLPVESLDQLLETIVLEEDTQNGEGLEDHHFPSETSDSSAWLGFFSWSAVRLSKWEFANEAALHASVAAEVLQIQRWPAATTETPSDRKRLVLRSAALKLAEAGYYSHSAALLHRQLAITGGQLGNSEQCLLAFVRFLQGDLSGSLSETMSCAALDLGDGMPSLHVAQEAFLRLVRLETSNHDLECLRIAVATKDTNLSSSCCFLNEYSGRSDEPMSPPSRRFSSPFVKELFHALNVMGVFLDELGAFTESLLFFKHAAQLCESDRLSLQLRQILAVPVVFASQDDMNSFFTERMLSLQTFTAATKSKRPLLEQVVSPLGDTEGASGSAKAHPTLRPEHAAYLQFTITPPTMLIGYQGSNVLPIQRAVHKLRSTLFPSLSSPFTGQDPIDSDVAAPVESHKRRRIGFISTWFRRHSVGKLLLGVIQKLDRTKFHIAIYRCVHFLRDADELTQSFKHAADEYLELPTEQDSAVLVLRQARLDVVVYPELGMDEWTVLLSHHRVASVQCVFWGHPITTGNPHIDYFISSEHFVSKHFDESTKVPNAADKSGLELSQYSRASFSEKVVLFRGLSTIFSEPEPLTMDSEGITRTRLHLPTNRRLYVCPQTLMKLHPAFDEALAGILGRDEHAIVVLLASATQAIWTEKLRRRFRRRFGPSYRRVFFSPTLPFAEFQALLSLADVVLDPFPFGGGVTTLDALHLGIPVVTLPAAQSVVHLAAGFLRYMNASDCIAQSLGEYVALAVAIASDPSDIRARLLAHRTAIYEDTSTIEDWNTFLSAVAPTESNLAQA